MKAFQKIKFFMDKKYILDRYVRLNSLDRIYRINIGSNLAKFRIKNNLNNSMRDPIRAKQTYNFYLSRYKFCVLC